MTARAGTPLAGIRVLDFSRLFAGPYCTMTLADLGADVIKVEAPGGDDARRFGPPFLGDEGMNFLALNRNKRGVVIDLKSPEGRDLVRRMAAEADVVVENFRPGVAARLGIDYETLSAVNPRLVYCSISGFGAEGEYQDKPALDIVLQAMTGVMDRQGRRSGQPELLVVTVADTYAAALAVQSILAALLVREREGVGQAVEVTLFEALVAAQGYRIISPSDHTMLPGFDDTYPYQAFVGSDGVWFVIAVVSPRNWTDLCAALGRPELEDDPRFRTNPDRVTHRDELCRLLEDAFRQRPGADWVAALTGQGVPVGLVRSVEDVLDDQWCRDRGLVVESDHPRAGRVRTMGSPLHFSRSPVTAGGHAPVLGEHTTAVLTEYGVDPDEIQRLVAARVVHGQTLTTGRSPS